MTTRPFPFASTIGFPIAAILAASICLPGCMSYRVPFTQAIRNQYDLKSEDLKNLQYYLSADITLPREFRREEGEVSQSHKLVAKEAGLVEEVVIRARTPGIATEVGETYIAISFEPGKRSISARLPRTGIPSGGTSCSRRNGPTRTAGSFTEGRPTTPWGAADGRTSRCSSNRSTR